MKLKKKFYTSKSTDKIIDRSFSELKKEEEKMSIFKFFQHYSKLFYEIPKVGSQSHSVLFQRSGDYLDDPTNSKDKKIKELQNKIIELEAQIADLKTTLDIR
tara:strand:- start:1214 stop:1519 length:306 start_codon:yes stop_codon:yes gene_type:complete